MQTGQEIFNRALELLHYTDGSGETMQPFGELTSRALPVINQIYSDLWYTAHDDTFCDVPSLTVPLDLPTRLLNDVMPYGVAMLLAQGCGDSENQRVFAEMYSQKRAAGCRILRRINRLF